jgi:hypothetical protein
MKLSRSDAIGKEWKFHNEIEIELRQRKIEKKGENMQNKKYQLIEMQKKIYYIHNTFSWGLNIVKVEIFNSLNENEHTVGEKSSTY